MAQQERKLRLDAEAKANAKVAELKASIDERVGAEVERLTRSLREEKEREVELAWERARSLDAALQEREAEWEAAREQMERGFEEERRTIEAEALERLETRVAAAVSVGQLKLDESEHSPDLTPAPTTSGLLRITHILEPASAPPSAQAAAPTKVSIFTTLS